MSKIVRGTCSVLVAGLLTVGMGVCSAHAANGAEIFADVCAPCHGDKGKGNGAAAATLDTKPTDLTTLKGTSDDVLTKAIKEGGEAVGKPASMPAFGSSLSDEDIKAVIAYIRSL